MQTSQVDLKDPLLAAILAYLVPGLGHLYQKRFFKAAVYSACIISLYVFGLSLSNWKIVQYSGGPGEPRTEMLSFMAQAGVGLPGLFAINQTRRARRAGDRMITAISDEISTSFVGTVLVQDGDDPLEGDVTGQLNLAPVVGRFNEPVIVGNLNGQLADGREVNLTLGQGVRLGPILRNDPRRVLFADIVRLENGNERRIGRVDGTIPRSFWNWFAVPLSKADEGALHGELGKYHELALVFTMIAGLLNILAVWDAYDGPAYGFGREGESREKEKGASAKGLASDSRPTTADVAS